ncbi:MAG: tRNA (adenosine(37)-N6)-dimethylallyltransferase MiaA [Bacteroidales bacterium]|nr:tRNA (adenosine(37)-N6)-dimethylallyltransferase MiaA [Bacteroidales bacterium]
MENILGSIKQGGWDAVCILGPTASGKTKFAVELARTLTAQWKPCEIISADSRQVYRGMDIGTGKDLSEYGEVPAHLLDIVDAGTKYNIFEYQKDFSKAYTNILERGCFPIICGGSGLYIEAATRGYELYEVLPDEGLRARLEPKPMEELVQMLKDLKAAKGVKPHNDTDWDTKKRVIRAIEIEMAQAEPREPLPLPQNVLFIGVSVDRDTRNARIDARLEARLQEGMVEEVKRLLDGGIPAEDLIYYGLEYKFLTQYIIGELTYEEMVNGLSTAIHQFAKRQMTWFRGMERKGVEIHWVER